MRNEYLNNFLNFLFQHQFTLESFFKNVITLTKAQMLRIINKSLGLHTNHKIPITSLGFYSKSIGFYKI